MKAKYITYLLIMVVVFLSFTLIGNSKDANRFKSQMYKYKLENKEFKEDIDEKGDKILSQEQVILTQKEAIRTGLVELDNFKKLSNQIKIVTDIKIDTIVITNHDTLVTYVNGFNYLKLPVHYAYNSEFLNLDVDISVDHLSLNSINILNESKISLGYKKQGLFKPLIPVIEITNSNPYIKTNSIQNITIVEERRLIDDKKFLIGIGMLFGLLIN